MRERRRGFLRAGSGILGAERRGVPPGAVLLELVAPCDRLLACVTAAQSVAMAAFACRRQAEAEVLAAEHPVLAERGLASSTAVEELAARRRTTRHDALVDIARSVLEGDHGPVQHPPARSAGGAPSPVVHVTMPAATRLGASGEPGVRSGALSGARELLGPIPADQARAIAADATWRRVLPDPTRRVIEVSERTYRPSAHLSALVRTDHPACTAP